MLSRTQLRFQCEFEVLDDIDTIVFLFSFFVFSERLASGKNLATPTNVSSTSTCLGTALSPTFARAAHSHLFLSQGGFTTRGSLTGNH